MISYVLITFVCLLTTPYSQCDDKTAIVVIEVEGECEPGEELLRTNQMHQTYVKRVCRVKDRGA